MDNEAYIICERCGDEIPPDECNNDNDVWDGVPLCNECYAILTTEEANDA